METNDNEQEFQNFEIPLDSPKLTKYLQDKDNQLVQDMFKVTKKNFGKWIYEPNIRNLLNISLKVNGKSVVFYNSDFNNFLSCNNAYIDAKEDYLSFIEPIIKEMKTKSQGVDSSTYSNSQFSNTNSLSRAEKKKLKKVEVPKQVDNLLPDIIIEKPNFKIKDCFVELDYALRATVIQKLNQTENKIPIVKDGNFKFLEKLLSLNKHVVSAQITDEDYKNWKEYLFIAEVKTSLTLKVLLDLIESKIPKIICITKFFSTPIIFSVVYNKTKLSSQNIDEMLGISLVSFQKELKKYDIYLNFVFLEDHVSQFDNPKPNEIVQLKKHIERLENERKQDLLDAEEKMKKAVEKMTQGLLVAEENMKQVEEKRKQDLLDAEEKRKQDLLDAEEKRNREIEELKKFISDELDQHKLKVASEYKKRFQGCLFGNKDQ